MLPLTTSIPRTGYACRSDWIFGARSCPKIVGLRRCTASVSAPGSKSGVFHSGGLTRRSNVHVGNTPTPITWLAGLQGSPPADPAPGERTALALLRLAGAETAAFNQTDSELRKAELEAASSEITREVLEYGSQKKNLLVELDLDSMRLRHPRDTSRPFSKSAYETCVSMATA